MRGDVEQPVFAQQVGVDLHALLFQRRQPQQLDIQVVVGQPFTLQILGVESDLVDLAAPLEGRPQRPADVLAHPTAGDFIEIFGAVKIYGVILSSSDRAITNVSNKRMKRIRPEK